MAIKHALGQLGDYEIRQLKVFKAVADCGGFSAAETLLNISRPTISIHIANLESRLNLILCRRGRGGFALTKEGEVIYQQTQQLLDALEGFRNTINNLSSTPSGKLRVALSDSFANDPRCQFTAIINHYAHQAPAVEVTVDVSHMIEMERKVLNDELDLAFIPYHRQLEGLDYIHLFSDRCYLYCGASHPLFHQDDSHISNTQINAIPLVHAGLQPHEEVYQQIAAMNLAAVSYHYETRVALIRSGIYASFLPENIAAPYVQDRQLRAICPQTRHYSLGAAVISKRTSQPNRARTLFIQTVQSLHQQGKPDAPY
ncbi:MULTISPECIES: LysR family transcriptional regulator [unclassified Oceanobacter]|uniref:LysR family transcriptional regulator n=1 Tax=unclassified Oceanobacter TaxID=2620260 RepID=UPI002736B007|nr:MULTISPECIES: LysR family transcriptional regulator [unclassified Oceanobacter]MDP2507279.1 LysR family transcriptional regulator [Oceanobacter sp. 3_MG-2023]MDP2549289.1 LysR family transcriptional regulator [Oceanobacter sp. 4_MG-2023]MDP2609063.1 LysR family transcriptional regulator [Oceanobacter sp. 1_MG-2023]MDP2612385.1 LysR family transcriptional regulator [Oceanobacter sp. 2_MG-2023]